LNNGVAVLVDALKAGHVAVLVQHTLSLCVVSVSKNKILKVICCLVELAEKMFIAHQHQCTKNFAMQAEALFKLLKEHKPSSM
jgi:hypothetical protein